MDALRFPVFFFFMICGGDSPRIPQECNLHPAIYNDNWGGKYAGTRKFW